jgi:predicted heme/steroid binding protein
MLRRFKCPNCRHPLAVRTVVIERVAIEEQSAAPEEAGKPTSLAMRVERWLAAAGRRGLTVREIQQRAQGTAKSEDIRSVLEPLVYKDGQDGPVYEERRGRAYYFVLKAAAWREASEADAASAGAAQSDEIASERCENDASGGDAKREE